MSGLCHDTAFTQLVRLVTRKRLYQFREESRTALCVEFLEKQQPAASGGHSESDVSYHTGQDSLSNGERPAARSKTSQDELSTSRNEGADGKSTTAPQFELVDWYGPGDEANPQNWPASKKFLVTFQICILTTAIYSGSSIYSAATSDVVDKFDVSEVKATLGLTLFVLGYGLGPMLWSPMSEVPFIGRNPVYISTLAVFVALQAAVVKSSNYSMLMAFRFLTGFVGSPVLATGGATCADLYKPSKRAYAISIWGVAAVCGPALGPLVGGYVTEYGPLNETITAPWQWPMYTLMWLAAACLLVIFFFLPETSSSNILYRRAQRLRRSTGRNFLSQSEVEARQIPASAIVNMCLVLPFTLNFTEPMVFLLNLYVALIYGLLYIWFESFPLVFMGIYGFSLGELGLAFLGMLGGVIFILPLFCWWYRKYLEPQFDASPNGEIIPEKRLPTSFIGAFCIPICLFWFGWSSRPEIHWIVPIIGTAWFSIGSFLMFLAILNYLPDAYPKHIPSVLAGNDLFRSSFGAAFPLFARAMYKDLGIGWASSTLAFISIAFIPIPFVLWKYGAVLRNRYSAIAKKDDMA